MKEDKRIKVLIVVALVATFVLMCCMRMSSICSREEERKENDK